MVQGLFLVNVLSLRLGVKKMSIGCENPNVSPFIHFSWARPSVRRWTRSSRPRRSSSASSRDWPDPWARRARRSNDDPQTNRNQKCQTIIHQVCKSHHCPCTSVVPQFVKLREITPTLSYGTLSYYFYKKIVSRLSLSLNK